MGSGGHEMTIDGGCARILREVARRLRASGSAAERTFDLQAARGWRLPLHEVWAADASLPEEPGAGQPHAGIRAGRDRVADRPTAMASNIEISVTE